MNETNSTTQIFNLEKCFLFFYLQDDTSNFNSFNDQRLFRYNSQSSLDLVSLGTYICIFHGNLRV